MKCQVLFSLKNINKLKLMSSATILHSTLRVRGLSSNKMYKRNHDVCCAKYTVFTLNLRQPSDSVSGCGESPD